MRPGNRISAPERLPSPEPEYDPQYMDRLVTLIDQHLSSLNGRRRILGTTMQLTDLPTSSTDLRPGEIYNDSGTLKIVT